MAVASVFFTAISSRTVLPVVPLATAEAVCALNSCIEKISKRLTRHTWPIVLEASVMVDLLSSFISLDVCGHYSALACIGAIHAEPRGETSLARRHSEKPRMIRAITCANVLLFVPLSNYLLQSQLTRLLADNSVASRRRCKKPRDKSPNPSSLPTRITEAIG